MGERSINVWAYNLETILAEKLETIIARSDQNTRPRDLYDVYVLQTLQEHNIDFELLRDAILATAKKRSSEHLIANSRQIIRVIEDSDVMHQWWNLYQKSFEYARDITFPQVCNAVIVAMEKAFTRN